MAAEPSEWPFPFLSLWAGQAASLLGSMLVQFALIWWLTEQTGSGTVLALATIMGLAPGIFLGPFIGVLVGRRDRRRGMMFADRLMAGITAGLILLTTIGRLHVAYVLAALLARSTLETLHGYAMLASTALLVPERHLIRVSGLNQALQGALGLVAPPMGLCCWGSCHSRGC